MTMYSVVDVLQHFVREEQSKLILSTKLFINPRGEALQHYRQSSHP